jgi:hypothetical protein
VISDAPGTVLAADATNCHMVASWQVLPLKRVRKTGVSDPVTGNS